MLLFPHLKKRIVLLILACLLALTGCDGLKSCSSTALVGGFIAVNWSYTCSATYTEITDTQQVSFDFDDVNQSLSGGVDTTMRFSVQFGSVQVSFFDENNLPITLNISEGETVEWSGRTRVRSGPRVNIEITPVGGKAGNVHYEVNFSG